jgi:hypothetical protein
MSLRITSLAPLAALAPLAFLALASCGAHGGGSVPPETSSSVEAPVATNATSAPLPAVDDELVACRARVAAIEAAPAEAGAPALDAARPEFLGRVRGEPMVFVREPRATPDAELPAAWLASRRAFERTQPGAGRMGGLLARHRRDPAALRALVLREGYAYAPDPIDALALVTGLSLADLFAEPAIWIQRGADTRRLERVTRLRETTYRYVDGPLSGRAADLLFGDRVARTEAELAAPLHRDLRALADVEGFDRTRIARRTEGALLADLRYGDRWVHAVLDANGARLSLGCLAEDREAKDGVQAARAAQASRRRGMLALHETVDHELAEVLRFDRPEGVKGAEHDGELRPVWMTAYLQGRASFAYEGASYPVFDAAGNAWPPQVCVDFVLDSFERTSGTWFAPRGEPLLRRRGRLDFDEAGIQNRRGVLAFGAFAEARPALFETRRFVGPERIQFKERSRFFAFLEAHADEVRAGDVVAIHGMKADEHIHQHAILIEWTDPVTGFPSGLADQMKRPRRRTWEGIMAEAPLRSLLYRVRPRDAVFEKLDPGAG